MDFRSSPKKTAQSYRKLLTFNRIRFALRNTALCFQLAIKYYNIINMKNLLVILAFHILIIGCAETQSPKITYSEQPVTRPQLFAPGIISTEDKNEFDLCFTPDGKTVYFTRRIPDTEQKIYRTDYVEGSWQEPKIASFSTDRDETPFISPDGNTLYFGSQREIPGKPNKGEKRWRSLDHSGAAS